MEKIERKLTEEECVENGGHFWNYFTHNQEVNPKTFKPTGIYHDVYFPAGEPKYRGCPLCGKVEREIPARWE